MWRLIPPYNLISGGNDIDNGYGGADIIDDIIIGSDVIADDSCDDNNKAAEYCEHAQFQAALKAASVQLLMLYCLYYIIIINNVHITSNKWVLIN